MNRWRASWIHKAKAPALSSACRATPPEPKPMKWIEGVPLGNRCPYSPASRSRSRICSTSRAK
jgi:hypothetical protein